MRPNRLLYLSLLLAAPAFWAVDVSGQTAKKPQHHAPAATESPLIEREKAAQLLNRFTFGPRPGDLDVVMTLGPENWFEQQLNPDSIPNPVLDQRLQDYPALSLTAAQTVANFPTNQILRRISEGKLPYPQDPVQASVFQVLVTKYQRDQQAKKDEQANKMTPEQIESQKAEEKKRDQAQALEIVNQLLSKPK